MQKVYILEVSFILKRMVFVLLICTFLIINLVACSTDNVSNSSEESKIVSSSIEKNPESDSSSLSSSSSIISSSESASSNMEDNASTNPSTSSTAPPPSLQVPDTTEQDLQDFLLYLEQSLTNDQHGGLYRDSDFNGSGLSAHGGPDRADPYIVIWVVDKNVVNRVVESYTGRKVFIVYNDAAYSMNQLNSIADELRNSDIASLTNGIEMGYGIVIGGNRVGLDIIGENSKAKVDSFLETYRYKDAVAVSYRSGNEGNPDI